MFTLSRMVVATSLAGLLCLSALAARAETILGQPRIVDGDTVEIGEKKIRLLGLDAPETEQLCLDAKGEKWACGIAARDTLTAFSKNRPWSCDAAAIVRLAELGEDPDCLIAEIAEWPNGSRPPNDIVVAQSERLDGEWVRIEGELRIRTRAGEAEVILKASKGE